MHALRILPAVHNGEIHAEVIWRLRDLAEVLIDKGDLAGGATLQAEALDFGHDVLGHGHREITALTHTLAMTVSGMGRFDEASALLRNELEIARACFGDESWRVVTGRVRMGHG